MEDEPTDAGATRQPVTVNQVVAWNIAYYRRVAGLTQKELGEWLGWTNNAVSEAERSWGGARVREFDAQTLAQLCLALGVPLIALFLPPDETGTARYVFTGPGGGVHDMADLTARIVMPDSAGDAPAMEAYRDRLRSAVTRYLDPEWAEEVAGWLREIDDGERLDDRAERLRARQAELIQAAEEIGDLASAIEKQRRQR